MRSRMSVGQGPGRPTKYGRPSRVVTLTLPQDVLARLGAVDDDLGRAIVTMVERRRLPRPRARLAAELASYGSHAVIVVTPVKALRRLAGVQLVPIGNGRALISLTSPKSIAQLELSLRDAVDDSSPHDRPTLEAIVDLLRQARLTPGVSVEERTIIVLESKRRRERVTRRSGTR